MFDLKWEVSKMWSKESRYHIIIRIVWFWLCWNEKGKEANMKFLKQVLKPKNLKVLTSFLPFSGQVYSQLPPMSMHFKHDSSSLIASIWKSGTCFSCPFFDILTQSLPKKTMVFCYQNCSDILWEKVVLVIEKNFWDSRLKAENL